MGHGIYVCYQCVGDSIVSGYIRNEGKSKKCNYCGSKRKSIHLEAIADLVDDTYRANFRPLDDLEQYYSGLEIYDSGDSPDYVIGMILQSDGQLCSDIRAILGDREARDVSKGDEAMYDEAVSYISSGVDSELHSSLWDDFCRIIKHESRFFSSEAKDLLDGIFKGIDSYLTASGESAIYKKKFTKIYRARRANSATEIKKISENPDKELFVPPADVVPNGRMNPRGISLFYGSLDLKTCLAELRLVVGERAVCGQFSSNDHLRVFDFTKLKDISHDLSYFDKEYAAKCSQIEFLSKFESIISRPILPGKESLDYLPTQAMTEYLCRFVHGGIDAVIFSSCQTGRDNIAAVVSPSRVSEDIDVIEYRYEPSKSLTLIKDSVSVHRITAVEYKDVEIPLKLIELESFGDNSMDSFDEFR